MATAIDFPQKNHVFKAPGGAEGTDLDVYDLPVCLANGNTSFSCWQLTHDEIEEITRTGKVWLAVYGATHPPVAVIGNNPFDGQR